MAFRTPTLPLTALVWRAPAGNPNDYTAPDLTLAANLAVGRRTGPDTFDVIGTQQIMVSKRADVRATWNGVNGDVIECPAGTKRFYLVEDVIDVGRGFLNEYRLIVTFYAFNGVTFTVQGLMPAPVPFP